MIIIGLELQIAALALTFFLSDSEQTESKTKQVINTYKPSDFKSNYQIDLKQDGYLILDQQGEVYYVPFDSLEEWFIEDNI